MKVTETAVPGVLLLEAERLHDERGYFARTFSRQLFSAYGIDGTVEECSVAFNPLEGTLRGMHYQREPAGETKLVRCVRGVAYDVALDLRPGSPTHRRWTAVELSARSGLSVVIPPGVAHGYLTLEPDTELAYQMSVPHSPEHVAGVRYDDPAFGIDWPHPPALVSARDLAFPPFPEG
jgi:dTDP-4-dehydrorhamnose 3,5-epimerase